MVSGFSSQLENMMRKCLSTDDELFHVALYDWLFEKGLKERLLEVGIFGTVCNCCWGWGGGWGQSHSGQTLDWYKVVLSFSPAWINVSSFAEWLKFLKVGCVPFPDIFTWRKLVCEVLQWCWCWWHIFAAYHFQTLCMRHFHWLTCFGGLKIWEYS